ncbi:MAG: hypothetical protein GY754_19545 [bacterium]|nr:hypothetical protein [bacterium]
MDRAFVNIVALIEKDFPVTWLALSFFFFLLFVPYVYRVVTAKNKVSDEKGNNRVWVLVFLAGLITGIYAFLLNDLIFFCTMIVGALGSIAGNFILFDSNKIFTNKRWNLLIGALLLVQIGIGECAWYPLYLKYCNLPRGERTGTGFRLYFKNIYYCIGLASVFILFAPLDTGRYVKMDCLIKGDIYTPKFSQKYSKLFFRKHTRKDGCAIYSIDWEKTELYYPKKADHSYLSLGIDINENKNELYFIDRNNRALIMMDPTTVTIKKRLYHNKLNDGDFKIVHTGNSLYLLGENNIEIIKVNRAAFRVEKEKVISPLGYAHTGFVYYPPKDVLYLSNWYNPANPGGYYLWEVDTGTLSVQRRHLFPGPVSGFCLANARLYCAVLNDRYLYVLDINSFTIVDKIPVPFGTRGVAVDEERQLLFTGSALTNVIVEIDLLTGKQIARFKAGRCSLREIVLDTKRRAIYVSTRTEGLFVGMY